MRFSTLRWSLSGSARQEITNCSAPLSRHSGRPPHMTSFRISFAEVQQLPYPRAERPSFGFSSASFPDVEDRRASHPQLFQFSDGHRRVAPEAASATGFQECRSIAARCAHNVHSCTLGIRASRSCHKATTDQRPLNSPMLSTHPPHPRAAPESNLRLCSQPCSHVGVFGFSVR